MKIRIRTYSKSQLAMFYFPGVLPGSASRMFRRWLYQNDELQKRLEQTYYRKRCKYLTPLQVRIIVECLGEP